MALSKLQQEIINAPYDKTVVISAAASGKTNLLTEKVRQILRAGVNPREIAVITFTNMAASELVYRLGEDYKEGLFVGTIHSLANFMLSVKGINTKKVIADEDFDKLFEMVEQNPDCVRKMEWILLDEAQDSDELQFKFLFDMINPDCFFVVGDYRQAIYQFKGGSPKLMMRLARKPGVKLFDMNENYRNGRNILDFAKRILYAIGMEDSSIPMREISGTVTESPYNPQTIVEYITSQGNYKNWAILTRTNQEISTISSYLKKCGIPYDSFKQSELTREQLIKKMETDTVKLLTIHASKGLAFDNVIVVGARFHPEEERNVCYVAATRARNKLVWMSYPPKRKKKTYSPKMYEW